MKSVLVGSTNFSANCPEAKKMLLANGFEIIENPHQRPFTFEELSRIVGEVSAVIAGMEDWTEALYQMAPHLKIITKFGVGLDTIDIAAAQAHGISVGYAKGKNAVSVANMVVALIMSSMRKISKFDKTIREGLWLRENAQDLDGKTVGFVGFGDIARKAAKRISGFDVRILAYDVVKDEAAAKALNVAYADLDELLLECDIISIHLPNIPSTVHFFGKDQFARMKKTAILVNTARGPIVDQAALYNALASGQIGGAALDVYEQEPISPEDPLLKLDNITLTPHTAAETFEACLAVSVATTQNVIDYFNGINPKYLATPEPF